MSSVAIKGAAAYTESMALVLNIKSAVKNRTFTFHTEMVKGKALRSPLVKPVV